MCLELKAMLAADPRVIAAGLLTVDIATNPALLERFTYRVPVLFAGERELVYGRVERDELATALAGELAES
ncbi:MAG: glutaredoxin family protein [Gammaproteobacteria bacterium]|nr:glutaredoxin family protein [Gammaproteobacteria bacterium]